MIALLLTLAAQTCPSPALAEACAQQDACVARLYVARMPAEGVSMAEAGMVSRLEAERACSLVAWSRAGTSSATLSLVPAAISACPACPVPPPAPECGFDFVSALAGFGGGVLAGTAGAGAAGVYLCRGAP